MKIRVENLGAIKEGEIDLSQRMIVFCGPNGTGKTYMAYTLYALTKLNNKGRAEELKGDVIKKTLSENKFSLTIDPNNLWKFRAKELNAVKSKLWSLFSIAQDKNESFFKDTTIQSLEDSETFKHRFFEQGLKTKLNFSKTYQIVKHKQSSEVEIVFLRQESTSPFPPRRLTLSYTLLPKLYSFFAFFPITDSVIFPVERNSIFTFSKELSIKRNDTIDDLQDSLSQNEDLDVAELLSKRTTRYPQPIRDMLKVAEDLENIQKSKSDYNEFALEIEQELLKGKVIINEEGGVNFSSEKAPKVGLSFHQSASIVKTLASLVIYLKHQAKVNDLIIIDEPEINLHPDNQIILTRIFAKMINKGLRLLISTHSDYIAREINNLIMLGNANKKMSALAKELGNYADDEYIKQSEIGVYYFDYKNARSKQTEIKALEVTDSGFDIPSVNDTINKQNKISEELYYNLKYADNDD